MLHLRSDQITHMHGLNSSMELHKLLNSGQNRFQILLIIFIIMSHSHFQDFHHHQIIMSSTTNPELEIDPESCFVKKSSPKSVISAAEDSRFIEESSPPSSPLQSVINATVDSRFFRKSSPPLPSVMNVAAGSRFIKKTSTPLPSFINSAADSGFIKKSPSSTGGPHKERHPVITYTHSPKVIHTHPKDFMALVQKLTGYSPHASPQSESETEAEPEPEPEACDEHIITEKTNNDSDHSSSNSSNNNSKNRNHEMSAKNIWLRNQVKDSTSVEEERSCSIGHGFDHNEFINNNNNNSMPNFYPTSMDFLFSGPPFLERSSLSSSLESGRVRPS